MFTSGKKPSNSSGIYYGLMVSSVIKHPSKLGQAAVLVVKAGNYRSLLRQYSINLWSH